MLNSSWNIRINRAIELIQSQSPASELLRFYQQLARFQELGLCPRGRLRYLPQLHKIR
jgi:hypothetical protein